MLKVVAWLAFRVIKLVAWYHNAMQSYHTDAQQKIGAQLQQQKDQITTDATELKAFEDMRAIEEKNAALPDAVVDSELRAESAAHDTNA